jgi:hypothetical protein
MTASRKFGVFAVAFAVAYPIVYIAATELNWAAFTYHSALGRFTPGPTKPIEGPAMYWFGWITTSTVAAAIIAAIVAYLPDSLSRRLPGSAAWVVPLVAMATAAGLMVKMYFTR